MTHPVAASKLESSPASITIGIDVSKDHLDASRHPGGETIRVANTRKGQTALLRWIGDLTLVARVVFEPTGPYHRTLEERLAGLGVVIIKVNPRQARCFAEATGRLAKTDRVDARMLARYGALLEPVPRPIRSDLHNDLAELVAARRSLMRDRTATLNRIKTLTIDILIRHARHRLRQIEAQVTSLDAALEALVAENEDLLRRREILISIPGLGPVAAHTILADMPELGTMEEGQAASLAGLAPVTRQSGTWRGKSLIRGGRATLRQALYMPALVAMRFNQDLKRVYDRLIAKGKHAKVAITAIMRKLVVLANALLRKDRLWTPKAA
ncbi:IS110 family RNA-guided transposase [Kozakia baliensis]|uniref:Transposase n=1 Tax=Kozakia baliensis TaxID=153496 RepID=A0A1D8UY88_9PROT|nr:IS110 family transposase [Kozakia baliensis]AOX18600.1 transposase [Kozakia baliensis]GBR26989.1 transposase [Kozakia baliensis NRIC 0488]GEL65679.1 IS110 family transposase [Kozakia baliensis]